MKEGVHSNLCTRKKILLLKGVGKGVGERVSKNVLHKWEIFENVSMACLVLH